MHANDEGLRYEHFLLLADATSGLAGSALGPAWSFVPNGCNARVPPDSCIPGGAIIETGIPDRSGGVSRSAMIIWHSAYETEISPLVNQAFGVAVQTCILDKPLPLNLRNSGECLLRLGRRLQRSYVPRAILLVPSGSSAFATYSGGVYVCINRDHPDLPPSGYPSVMAIILR